MRYMIFDDEGNALASFRSRPAAERRMRAIAMANPTLADDLVMTVYDNDGVFTGRAVTVADLPPVRLAPTSWIVWVGYSMTRPAPAVEVNDYPRVVLAGRRMPETLVQPPANELVPTGQ